MLLLLMGCGLLERGPSPAQQCATAMVQAVDAWTEVADYFGRVAAMKEPATLDAEGAAELATERRQAVQGSKQVWTSRKDHGLVDAKTGEVRKDPKAREELAVKATQAGARVEVRTDEEAELLALAMELRAELDDLQDKESRAREVVLALEEDTLGEAATLSAERASELAQTELAAIARAAVDEAVERCP